MGRSCRSTRRVQPGHARRLWNAKPPRQVPDLAGFARQAVYRIIPLTLSERGSALRRLSRLLLNKVTEHFARQKLRCQQTEFRGGLPTLEGDSQRVGVREVSARETSSRDANVHGSAFLSS
jgi:hypothetical protein